MTNSAGHSCSTEARKQDLGAWIFTWNVHILSYFHVYHRFSCETATARPLCERPPLGARVAVSPGVTGGRRDGGREPGTLRQLGGGSGVQSDRQGGSAQTASHLLACAKSLIPAPGPAWRGAALLSENQAEHIKE